MAIFIQAITEEKVQVDDKTRIDVTKTFLSPDEAAITEITITPESGGDAINVTSNQYLDWAYGTAGEKTASVSVTTDGVATTKDITIAVVTEAVDSLFSNDQDIVSYEADIFRFLRPGRASFLDFHRAAQKIILDDLDQKGITDNDGNKLVVTDIYDVEEVCEWSKYITLALLFKSIQSEVDDIFSSKSAMYQAMADKQATRATIRLDLDNNDVVDKRPDLMTGRLVRR